MANKELTFGCKVKFSKWIYSIIDRENVWFLDSYKGVDWNIRNTIVIEDGVNSRCYSIEEIIGHPVMIGDVMYYIRKKYWNNHSWFHADRDELIDLRSKEREPIEWQYDECVNFVYSLIPKP